MVIMNGVNYYRIIDADYAFVGFGSELGPIVHEVIDSLRHQGLRVGAVTVEAGVTAWASVAELLAQVRAVGIVETGRRGRTQIAEALGLALHQAADSPDWCGTYQGPRMYAAVLSPGSAAVRADHLINLANAMHVYQPDRLLLTPDGGVKPIIARRPIESVTDREARMAVA
jgi:pyruvate/2-oxoacid:ferredoxin oxidoreductase alpha subunit